MGACILPHLSASRAQMQTCASGPITRPQPQKIKMAWNVRDNTDKQKEVVMDQEGDTVVAGTSNSQHEKRIE